MRSKKQEYVKELVEWGESIEASLTSIEQDTGEWKAWKKDFSDWKEKARDVSQQDTISDEDIQRLQLQAKKLLDVLQQFNTSEEHRATDSVPIGKHTLPPLPYSYDALEPYISKEIMKLHHDQHHQSYVEGLNEAEQQLQQLRKTGKNRLIRYWLRQQAFHGSGHFLHTIFWNSMSPNGGGKPKGDLLQRINRDFGSYSAFKRQFSEAAKSVEAVGWALLVWELRSGRLAIQTAEKHQQMALWDVIPILLLDVWEHAYYLQYDNKRGEYVDNWWNIVNWRNAEKRFNRVKNLTWELF
ncbi:superoxide dismutase [Pontibacillus halophilus JSM 076056 = DSM 19796]|uniref:superoxide dismutase n=1 Tax=Pontibacillus halophilus JSM 076056 = DSM 19796 TaxID=1385510 RepID=A0A0A5GG34_9BACI|nr:superoxide dismutase [Pontibacillus halophilus]KGX92211.1 superoxide dismutase [Pontibacillus halophilus JSM 076056 = DSM 19796]